MTEPNHPTAKWKTTGHRQKPWRCFSWSCQSSNRSARQEGRCQAMLQAHMLQRKAADAITHSDASAQRSKRKDRQCNKPERNFSQPETVTDLLKQNMVSGRLNQSSFPVTFHLTFKKLAISAGGRALTSFPNTDTLWSHVS